MSFIFKQPEQSPGFLLWQLTNEWQRKQRTALKKLGLTHGQFVVLANMLWFSSQSSVPVTQQHIVELAKIDKMMMSDLVKTLLKKKLINRIQHQDDGRCYQLTLTTKGKNLILKALPVVEGIDLEFFTAETTNLVHLMNSLRHIIDDKK